LPDKQSEDLCNDRGLIEELIETIEQWTATIKETIERENQRPKDTQSAQGETEYWRQRAATFNTLYQQLNKPQVKKIIKVMELNEQRPDGYQLDNYTTQYQAFQKLHAQAKDFVKFLTTLDRQFKNIARGDL
jgi:dynein heavy chain